MKCLACLVCICAVLTTVFAGVSLAEVCDHSCVFADQYRTTWLINDMTHRRVHQRMQVCVLCVETCWCQVKIAVPEATHALSVKSNWHNGNGTHSYVLRCSVCGYSRTETRSCDGPPCMNYMGVPIPVIVVDE